MHRKRGFVYRKWGFSENVALQFFFFAPFRFARLGGLGARPRGALWGFSALGRCWAVGRRVPVRVASVRRCGRLFPGGALLGRPGVMGPRLEAFGVCRVAVPGALFSRGGRVALFDGRVLG